MLRRAALDYASRGWRVLPIWWTVDGHCACGNPYCPAPGKHPLVATGQRLAGASSDPAVIDGWWQQWPGAYVAVACGPGSGIVVVDLDIHGDDDGELELRGWAAGQGFDLPDTLMAETGSGGRHMLFAWPDDGGPPIRNATGWLQGVDVKSDGGYILVAPSGHVSGGHYRWLNDNPPAPLGPLLGPLRAARSRGNAGGGGDTPEYDYKTAVKEGPPAGARDHFFNARAFELRRSDVEKDAALADLRRIWERTSQPAGREYAWESVVEKVSRVWETVEPDPLPTWDPFGTAGVAPPPGMAAALPPSERTTDVGNAHRLVRLHGVDLRYAGALGWLVWDGKTWANDTKERTMEMAKATCRQMFLEAAALEGDDRNVALTWAKQSESRQRLEAMVRLARTDSTIALDVSELDQHPLLLACANGIIDLETGALREYDRSLLISHRSRVVFDPLARSEKWEKYLASVTDGDEELQAYLCRAAGYTLTGLTIEEVFFILHGPKGAGKSTFIDAISTALGPLSLSVGDDVLTQMKGKTPPLDALADMFGKRLVTSVELPDRGKLSESLVKRLTGGDAVRGRHLYRNAFEFRPTFKLWIATNHAPRIDDDAMWRRIKKLPLPREVPVGERDLRLKQEATNPDSEMARAVLAWAVRGCYEWLRFGLGTCTVVEADTEQYREDQDLFGQFLDEECELEGEARQAMTVVTEVYERYRAWCQRAGMLPMSKPAFNTKMTERGFTKVTKVRPICWHGLQLRAQSASIYGL